MTRAKSLGFMRLPSFKSSDSDSSEDYDLHYVEYDKENYAKIAQDYVAGKRFINIDATGIIFECAVRVLEGVNKDLLDIVGSGKLVSYPLVRKFIVDSIQLDDIAVSLYAAM